MFLCFLWRRMCLRSLIGASTSFATKQGGKALLKNTVLYGLKFSRRTSQHTFLPCGCGGTLTGIHVPEMHGFVFPHLDGGWCDVFVMVVVIISIIHIPLFLHKGEGMETVGLRFQINSRCNFLVPPLLDDGNLMG